MISKKKVTLVSIVIFATLIIGSGIVYLHTAGCIELRGGTVSAKIKYSKAYFFSWSDSSYISLYAKKDADFVKQGNAMPIISINLEKNIFSDSVDSIIKTSLVEPGPKFIEKTNLYGYEAAVAYVNDHKYGSWKDYEIPLGNQIVDITLYTDGLSVQEKDTAQKAFDSITFKVMQENFEGPDGDPQDKKCLF